VAATLQWSAFGRRGGGGGIPATEQGEARGGASRERSARGWLSPFGPRERGKVGEKGGKAGARARGECRQAAWDLGPLSSSQPPEIESLVERRSAAAPRRAEGGSSFRATKPRVYHESIVLRKVYHEAVSANETKLVHPGIIRFQLETGWTTRT